MSSRGLTAFTVPCVPTGMKTGVSMTPCAVVNRAAAGFALLGEELKHQFFALRVADALGSFTSMANIIEADHFPGRRTGFPPNPIIPQVFRVRKIAFLLPRFLQPGVDVRQQVSAWSSPNPYSPQSLR